MNHPSIRSSLLVCLLPAILTFPACRSATDTSEGDPARRESGNIAASARHAALAHELVAIVSEEIERHRIPAFSIALVDGDNTVWARGFGTVDSAPGRVGATSASADTVYRVGSVSKLFTAIALMQLVERGVVELDAPVTSYLPQFRLAGRTESPITLRQLMCHRAGIVRESPVGNYFDASEPGLAATVDSLATTGLVYVPGSRTKYSNAGVAVAGHVLEEMASTSFATYLKRTILEPLGMHRSAFEPAPAVVEHLANARMWTYDGDEFDAPRFELGTSPAGSMYSTVRDLARFLIVLFRGGELPGAAGGRLLEQASLETMWTPQFAAPGASRGFGLGFAIGETRGHRVIEHRGAIYGFSTTLRALPDVGLGVVAVSAMDGTNRVVDRIADFALEGLLAVRENRTPTLGWQSTLPLTRDDARRLAGGYDRVDRTSGADSAEERVALVEQGGRLYLRRGSLLLQLRWLDSARNELIVDGRLGFGRRIPVRGEPATIEVDGRDYARSAAAVSAPRPPREEWRGLIGEYGFRDAGGNELGHNVMYILEREDRLWCLIEWFYAYPLTEVARDVFAFPGDHGLYHGEKLVFERGADGRAARVTAASVVFERREVGTPDGETFHIVPKTSAHELRAKALAATPPPQAEGLRRPELVDLAGFSSGAERDMRFDIRYATTNNFMRTAFYDTPRAYLQRPAAEALARVHGNLAKRGYGLLIHDAYRPWYVTKMFWDATPESMKEFAADPSRGSRHNRGCAVDLTLYDLETGEPVQMVSGYDEFTQRAYAYYPGGTARQRWLRDLLRRAMEDEGFRVYDKEWWHFDYGSWQEYPVLNATLTELDRD